VVQTGHGSDGTAYLTLGNLYPDPDRFTIAISAGCEGSFTSAFGERPTEYFDGEEVVAHGEIELDRYGEPILWLCEPSDIQLCGTGGPGTPPYPDLVITSLSTCHTDSPIEVVITGIVKN
jgi:hypothetical protein